MEENSRVCYNSGHVTSKHRHLKKGAHFIKRRNKDYEAHSRMKDRHYKQVIYLYSWNFLAQRIKQGQLRTFNNNNENCLHMWYRTGRGSSLDHSYSKQLADRSTNIVTIAATMPFIGSVQ